MMTLIRAGNLTVRHGSTTALSDVNFEINKGEIVTLIGPNGSGKSTFVRALLGVVRPSGGFIERQSGLVIGYVPQKISIDQTLPLSVARFLSLPKRQRSGDIARILQRVGAPNLEERQMAELSGGQFQRVLLARALLMKPDILILDEPTQGLDQPGIISFYGLIEEVRRDLGCAVLLVSHDLHIVMRATDRVICLNGHICCQGTPEAVSEAPEYQALFGMGATGALAMYHHHHDHSHDGGDHADGIPKQETADQRLQKDKHEGAGDV